MRRSNQQLVDGFNGSALPGPAPANDILSSAEAVYDANVTAAADILAARPQKAFRSANDPAFQASPRHDAQRGVSSGSSREYLGEAGGVDAGARGDTRSSNIVGDMVSGMPRAGEAFRDTVVDLGADLCTGLEPDGPQSANQPGPQNFYRSVRDYPNGQGSGTVPMEPTGYDNPA